MLRAYEVRIGKAHRFLSRTGGGAGVNPTRLLDLVESLGIVWRRRNASCKLSDDVETRLTDCLITLLMAPVRASDMDMLGQMCQRMLPRDSRHVTRAQSVRAAVDDDLLPLTHPFVEQMCEEGFDGVLVPDYYSDEEEESAYSCPTAAKAA